MFGCVMCFHTTASWQNICEFCKPKTGKAIGSKTYMGNRLWAVLGIHPYAFDANP